MNKKEKTPSPRRVSRELAVQALYQWQLSAVPTHELLLNFSAEHPTPNADTAYWQELVTECIQQSEPQLNSMRPFLSRPVEALNPVELAILRVAFYEPSSRLDIPYRVIINEAIDLAKVFGAVDSHRFINGVLDAAAKKLRTIEAAGRNQS